MSGEKQGAPGPVVRINAEECLRLEHNIHSAISRGDYDQFKILVNTPEMVNMKDAYGRTLLMEVASSLPSDPSPYSPEHIARIRMLSFLIAEGANKAERDCTGRTALDIVKLYPNQYMYQEALGILSFDPVVEEIKHGVMAAKTALVVFPSSVPTSPKEKEARCCVM